ncbi:MAG: hypothetical protein J6V50_01625, partial [Clostridia bacterium]|nr:hypothetical protein [Clostridia bacterium]
GELKKHNIDYKEYSGGKKLLSWLKTEFSEEFLFDEIYCISKRSIRENIVNSLTDLIEGNNGEYSLSEIADTLLSDYDIDYTVYANGRTVENWLTSDFANEFVIDGSRLLLSKKFNLVKKGEPEEIAQMHSIAFVSWWISNAKILQKYTGRMRSSEEWSSIVARGLSLGLLGEAPLFYYNIDQDTKIVFNTGLKSVDGNNIFCALKNNYANVGDNSQPYVMEGFCSADEEDSELWREIKQNVPDILKTDSDIDKKYEELRNDIEALLRYQEKIGVIIPELTEKVATGSFLDSNAFSAIKSYSDKWLHAKEIIKYLGWDIDDSSMNIKSIAAKLENKNIKSDYLNKAVDLFVDFAEAMSLHCKDKKLDKVSEIIDSDIEIAKASTPNQYASFKNFLIYYAKLIRIKEESSVDDTVTFINKHFESLNAWDTFGLMTHMALNEVTTQNGRTVPEEVLEALNVLDTMAIEEEENGEGSFVDAEELFGSVVLDLDSEKTIQILADVRNICSTKFEKALACADYDKCKTLISNGAVKDICEKSSEELLEIIEELEESDNALSLYDCAERFFSVLGNQNRTAEKFYIVGLLTNQKASAEALLDLYLGQNNDEKFYAVWKKYGKGLSLSSKNTKHLLHILSAKGEDVLREYLKQHIYIFYLPEYANSLLNDLNEFKYEKLSEICQSRISYISRIPEPNDFEKQILQISNNNNAKKALEYLKSSASLAETYGYTDEEFEGILATLESYESSEETYTPISRLYDVQKNKNGVVEKRIWGSVLRGVDDKHFTILLKIMNDEMRYDEAIDLFECYEETLAKNSEARSMYIFALVKAGNSRVYTFVKDNMQDCLTLISNKMLSKEEFTKAIESSSNPDIEDVALLCKKFSEITKYLDDFVLQRIIVLSDELRDLAMNPEKMVDFGINKEQVENFVSVYRTDSYSRGRDILSLALRLYSFVGAVEAAKDFALFALNCNFKAIPLLWKIYTDLNDSDALLDLLSKYPESRNGREAEYCALLFQKNEFEKFVLEVDKLGGESQELTVQKAIAKCHLGMDISGELDYLKKGINEISANYLGQLIAAMAKADLFSEISELIVNRFDEILSVHSINDIENIVSANGKLSDDELKKIQKAAIESDSQKLAMYIYENFGIGRLKGASKAFVEEALLDSANYSHLRIIYAKNKEYAIRIVLSEIEQLLSTKDDKNAACTEIERVIDGLNLDAEGVSALMELLKKYELPITPKMCSSLIGMCNAIGLRKECIEFFDSISIPDLGQDNLSVLYMLCVMYNETIAEAKFDKKWAEGAIKLGKKLINTEYSFTAEYCIYNVQKELGNKAFAKFNLFNILEQKQGIPTDRLSEIEAEAEKNQITAETTIFDLFVEMAEKSDLDEISEYCEYCGEFIHNAEALEEYYKANFNDTTAYSYSTESCAVLLKLLYRNPTVGEYWYQCAKMPLEEHPEIYAKLLYKASLLKNEVTIWETCIEACERLSQEDLLMDVLIDCVKIVPNNYNKFGVQEFRTNLAKKISTNPLYFSSLDNGRLVELVSLICSRMEEEPPIVGGHSALKDLSTIAIATNSKEAFSVMMKYAEKYIYGENSNLGFAIACRLILDKRFYEAKPIIDRLSQIVSVKYKNLIARLAAMSIEELLIWSSDNINIELLNMILPDGNYPDIRTINEFVATYTTGDKAESGAKLVCEILEHNPVDYGSYM